MEALEQIKEKIQSFLEALDSPLTLELSKHLQSGKMLRSKLVLNIAGVNEESILLCAVIEMIQSASLLHDDVIDNALMRRSKPSINAIAGDKNAIMLGDVFYSKAFCELVAFSKEYPQIPHIISDSVVKLSLGEIEDVYLSQGFNADERKYLAMIEKKTAALIESTAFAAALLAKKSLNDAKKFSLYGRNLGMAFQIIDDILDITSTQEKLGKPILSDFKEGKTTLPYIYLYHSLQEEGKERLKKAFKQEISRDEMMWILENLKKSGAITRSFRLAKNLGEAGIESISDQSCNKLVSIMQEMIDRDF
ncbi:polyprenyl synthetase family protein [Helicobacter mesocricetorum]|uniref:polyprenyl synthetase family protein n=1 Tax=Helicobacter mesocricetorum TaxID=87012 RepID=UPI000CF106F2|nr:polyprenyl synthetase family protein [Helicobacter mesocricetorum]